MSETKITIDDAIRINTEEGDTLLVTLPYTTVDMPRSQIDRAMSETAKAFEMLFADKDVRVIVAPHGTHVEVIQSSKLKDKDDAYIAGV